MKSEAWGLLRTRGPLGDDGTASCADSSKGPLDADDVAESKLYTQGVLIGTDKKTTGVPAILRKSYQIQHPIQTLRMAFDNITDEEYKEIKQYWHQA